MAPLSHSRHSVATVVAIAAIAGTACGGSQKKPAVPVADLSTVGECASVATAGQVSAQPELRHADRDLNRDGRDEVVVSDRKLCRGDNCHWNIFAWDGSCNRYVGTVTGAAIETGDVGESGFPEIRSWWRFSGGARALLHVYRFGGGGYQLIETLMCRQSGGDGIQCAPEEPL